MPAPPHLHRPVVPRAILAPTAHLPVALVLTLLLSAALALMLLLPAAPGLIPLLPAASLGAQQAAGVSASDAATAEEAEILAVLDRLFDGMRARDGAAVASAFHPQAALAVAPEGAPPEGPPVVTPASDFAASVGAGGPPFHEPYFAPEVRIDGNLAHVWTFFRFYTGDQFSHCGTNSFQLLRWAEGWSIVFAAYSRQTVDCPEG